MVKKLLFLLTLISIESFAQCDPDEIFLNDTTNAVCIDLSDRVRTIYTNNLPNHSYGNWPSGNPVDAQSLTFYMCAFPEKAEQPTSIYDAGDFMGCSPFVEFGVGINGIRIAPFGARWFVNPETQEENQNWNVEALEMFNMDFNNSHSNGSGEYHYHGVPSIYFSDSLNIDGSQHSPIVGYAADGFPLYYKYVYTDPSDASSSIATLTSGFTLKPGNRPGDGITAPDGEHDGFYVEDYEHLDPDWPLDECNGRYGVTPEYPNGTYYYVMTDNWPFIPRCFYGTVIDNTFRIGMNCPDSDAEIDCSEAVVNSIAQFENATVFIAPNPTSSTLQIFSNDASLYTAVKQVSIYDLNGNIAYLTRAFEEEIDISHLPAGTYFLQVNFDNAQVTKKILVQ